MKQWLNQKRPDNFFVRWLLATLGVIGIICFAGLLIGWIALGAYLLGNANTIGEIIGGILWCAVNVGAFIAAD